MIPSITAEQLEAIVSTAGQTPEWARVPAEALSASQRCGIAIEVELHCALGCLLRSEAFGRWLERRHSRLPWVTGMVFDALARELRQGLDLLDYTSASDPRCWRLAGVACTHRARRLAHRFGIPEPSILKAHFLSPPGPATLEQITCWLATFGRTHLLPVSDALDATYRLLRRLGAVAQARLTLERSTGHAGFECVLAELNTAWLLEGDLLQVLADDAERFRVGDPISQMLLYRDRAKTALFGPDQVPQIDDWDEPGPDDYYCREAGWVPSDPAQACAMVGLAPNHSGYPVGELPNNREYLVVHFGGSGEALIAPGVLQQQLRAAVAPDFDDL